MKTEFKKMAIELLLTIYNITYDSRRNIKKQ